MSSSSKDKENRRTCFKCGKSPAADSIKLFRFPKPAVRNLLRCLLWAKFMHPLDEQKYSSIKFQTMLYNEHRMLCQNHFLDEHFTDDTKQKLLRHAVPYSLEVEKNTGHLQVYSDAQAGPSTSAIFMDIGNISESSIADKSIEPLSYCMEPLPGPSQGMTCVAKSSVAIQSCKSKGPEVPMMPQDVFVETITDHLQVPSDAQADPSRSAISMDIGKSKGSIGKKSKPSKPSKIKKIKTDKEKQLYKKCAKYMKSICQLRNKTKRLKKAVILNKLTESNALAKLSDKLTPTFALLLQGQIRNFKKKGTGKRWSQNEKIVALRLYKRSPTCYRLMRRLFHLPAPSTLKVLLNRVPFDVGASESVLKVMENFVKTQTPAENNYILMFDEMSIKKNFYYNRKVDHIEGYQDHGAQGRSPNVASHALVFMIAGVRKKIKQPIAHYFSSSYSSADRLSVLLKEVLHKCLERGINIVATVCDMDGVNRRALNILGATAEQPMIKIDQTEIVTLFDTPHLLKCFRNLFVKYDIEFTPDIASNEKMGKGIAKWAHIKQFFEMDNKNKTFVFAPALTKEHLNPNAKQKMRVKLAAQVLSHSVAAGMYAKISDGTLTSEAAVTANLISNMDKLFDCLNSDCSDLRRGKMHATNMRDNTTPHKEMYKKMLNFFKNMKFIGCSRPPPSQEGWTWTINGVMKIFDNLTQKSKIKSLATRRLQQDPLENLFGCIRSNCGSNANPTVGQFVAGLKTSILSNLAHMGTSGNCEMDSNETINNFEKFLSISQPQKKSSSIMDIDKSEDMSMSMMDAWAEEELILDEMSASFTCDEDISSAEMQACAYVCGFLVKKLPIKSCHTCTHIFISPEIEKQHIFVEAKEYSETKKSLNYVNENFIKIVETCATVINKYLTDNGHKENLQKGALEAVANLINFDIFKKCPLHGSLNISIIIKSVFFICVKRFCIKTNRHFVEEASASALKRKMNIILHR